MSRSGNSLDVFESLTNREEEVLAALGEGKTSKEVALLLALSPATVSAHRRALCRKLRAHSTAELIRIATVFRVFKRDQQMRLR